MGCSKERACLTSVAPRHLTPTVHKMDGGDFTNYFLAFPEPGKENLSDEEKSKSKFSREGILELCVSGAGDGVQPGPMCVY